MNEREITRMDLVEGGNIVRQGHYFTLGYQPLDVNGDAVDLTDKDIAVTFADRKGVVYETTATFTAGLVYVTVNENIGSGEMWVEFTVTSSADANYRQKFPTNRNDGRLNIVRSTDDLDYYGMPRTTVTQFREEFDQAINALPVDSEINLARVATDGTVYPNLPARLEAEQQETAAQLAEKVAKVNGISPDVNGNVLVEVPEIDTSTLATKQEIANIGNASPKGTYATLAALQAAFPTGTTGIYIVTADGKWYYWNASAWAAGGVYQSTGLANNTVEIFNMSDDSVAKKPLERYEFTVKPNVGTSKEIEVGFLFTLPTPITSAKSVTVKYEVLGDINTLQFSSLVQTTNYTTVNTKDGYTKTDSNKYTIEAQRWNKYSYTVTTDAYSTANIRVIPKLFVADSAIMTKFSIRNVTLLIDGQTLSPSSAGVTNTMFAGSAFAKVNDYMPTSLVPYSLLKSVTFNGEQVEKESLEKEHISHYDLVNVHRVWEGMFTPVSGNTATSKSMVFRFDGSSLKVGQKYRAEYEIYSESSNLISANLELTWDNSIYPVHFWTGHGAKDGKFALTVLPQNEWVRVKHDFDASYSPLLPADTNVKVRVNLNVADATIPVPIKIREVKVYFDNIELPYLNFGFHESTPSSTALPQQYETYNSRAIVDNKHLETRLKTYKDDKAIQEKYERLQASKKQFEQASGFIYKDNLSDTNGWFTATRQNTNISLNTAVKNPKAIEVILSSNNNENFTIGFGTTIDKFASINPVAKGFPLVANDKVRLVRNKETYQLIINDVFKKVFAASDGINVSYAKAGTAVYSGVSKDHINKCTVFEEPNTKYMHFSVDDIILSLQELTNSSYTSIFQHPQFAAFKRLHDTYGAVFSLYCFYAKGTWNLSSMTDRFKAEFITNSDWLKMGFHSYDEATNYGNVPLTQTVSDHYALMIGEIIRFAGDEVIDTVPRLHYYAGSEANVNAMKNSFMGIRGLLASEDVRGNYYIGQEASYKVDNYFDSKNKIYFVKTAIRTENVSNVTTELNSILTNEALNGCRNKILLFTHENGTISGSINKFEDACKWAYENDYIFSFPMLNIPNS